MPSLNVKDMLSDPHLTRSELAPEPEPARNDEASFRYLFALTPLPMWIYDLQTLAFLEANDSAVATYGYSRDELLKMRLTDIDSAEDGAATPAERSDEPLSLPISGQRQHRLKEGRLIDVEIISQTLVWARRPAALIIARNITERQSVEPLQDNIQKLKIAYEQTTIYARELNRKITELKQAETALRQKADDLAVLYEASQVFLSQNDVETTLQTACQLVVERLNLQMSWVGLISNQGFEVNPVAAYRLDHSNYIASLQAGWDDSLTTPAPISQAIRTAQAVATHRLETDPTNQPGEQTIPADTFRSTAALPLLYDQQVLGVMNVYSIEHQHFSADRLQTLQSFANLLAVTLAKARLFVQAQRRLEELTGIYRASQRLQQLHTPETLAKEIIHVLAEMMAYEYGAVLLLDPLTERLIPFTVSDRSQEPHTGPPAQANTPLPDLRLGAGVTGWVAQTGQSVCLGDIRQDPRYRPTRAHIRSKLCVPLNVGNQIIGVVNMETARLNAYTEADQRVLETVAAQIAIAIQNARLFEQVQVGRERLQLLSQQLVDAQEAERRHIARELHDEIGQTLTAVKINLQAMQRLFDTSTPTAALADSMDIVEQAIQQVRNLSLDLRPSMLDDLGLLATLRWYLDRQAKWAGFTAQLTVTPPSMQLPSSLETVCFRLVQEALTNVLRHAQAHGVQVDLQQHETDLQLRIRDDGVGFETETILERVAYGTGLGLLGMQERVTLLGGRLDIHSSPGQGVEILVHLPIPAPSSGDQLGDEP